MKEYANGLMIVAATLWIVTTIEQWFRNRKWRKEFPKEVTQGLVKRVILVEGRCAKCDERLPDEVLEGIDLQKTPSIPTH